MDPLLTGLGIGAAVLVAMAMLLLMIKQLLFICKPNEIIVFSGRQHKLADGTITGYQILHQGLKVRVPIIETAERMEVSTMTVDIHVQNAYSKGNIPLSVHAIANVKICSRPGVVDNAVERFLGREREEIRRVAKETIEGALRGVLATLTPEQVNEDRLSFVEALSDEVEEDLNKIGLQVDTLKIQSVTDDVNYLDSIGRARIAEVLRDAEIAESDYAREADQQIADAQARGRVAQEKARANIQRANNELREYVAELEADARSEEERTTAAAQEARARAEVQLQEVRRELERLRLQAEEVLPAEAQREASELLAQGDSAKIAAQGQAAAEALRLMSEALKTAGENAEDIFIIQQIEPLVRRIAEQVRSIDIENINLVDGGDGESVGKMAASYPIMVQTILDTVGDTVGINIRDVLKRKIELDPTAPRPGRPSTAKKSVFQVRKADYSTEAVDSSLAGSPKVSMGSKDASEERSARAEARSQAPPASKSPAVAPPPVTSPPAPTAAPSTDVPVSAEVPAVPAVSVDAPATQSTEEE